MLISAGSCWQMRGSPAVWRFMSFSYSCSTSSVLNPNMILINWCEFLNFNHKNKWNEWRVVSGGSAETSFLFFQFDVSRVQSERFHLLWLFNKSSDSSEENSVFHLWLHNNTCSILSFRTSHLLKQVKSTSTLNTELTATPSGEWTWRGCSRAPSGLNRHFSIFYLKR